MRIIMFLFAVGVYIAPLHGQNITDSVYKIDEVVVNGRNIASKQDVGARITTVNTEILQSNKTRSLAELLSENSVIHIKSMGQGALSTASFRGTSSSHTQVTWNGIVINSPMMGNFDFSQIPVFFADNVSLFHGSGGQKAGSGALGGSVNFTNNSNRVDGVDLKLLSEYGTNNTYTEGVNFRTSLGRLTLASRAYFQHSDNDYRYLNKVFSKDQFYERRKNAGYDQAGFMQELYYDMGQKGMFSGVVWWQFDNRDLPPPIIVNHQNKEHQLTRNLRTLLSYDGRSGRHSYKVTASYLRNMLYYTRRFDMALGDTETMNRSHSWVANAEYMLEAGNKLDLGAAVNYRLDWVAADSYSSGKVSRNTVSGRIFGVWRPLRRLHFEAQGMVESVGKEIAPTYNVGVRWRAVGEWLAVKASNAYNHRFPSLNDLYWEPGGNINLRPEKGYSSDVTLSFTPQSGAVSFKSDITYYHMNITDWIMWIPTGNGYIWEPCNFNKVLSRGAELKMEIGAHIGRTDHKVYLNYGYTSSVDRSERGDKTLNKQLPYIPLNKWNARYVFNFMAFQAAYNVTFTDLRYTSADQSYATNAYFTHDCDVSYNWKLGKGRSVKTILRVNNIFDNYYESTQYYPMPLRMITFGVSLDL